MVPEHELNEVRELIEGSYRIIYFVKEDEAQIEVLAVIHCSREPLKPLQ
jgi:plasmid stabilization system protein ParE